MMQRILVEVGYYDFYFDCMDDAVEFAALAKHHIVDDVTVKITVKFKKPWEEVSEDGED